MRSNKDTLTKAVRRTRPLPENLRLSIEIVNKLSSDFTLPVPESTLRLENAMWKIRHENLTYSESMDKSIYQIRLSLWDKLANLTEDFRQYIWEDNAPVKSPSEEIQEPGFDLENNILETRAAAKRYIDFFELQKNFEILIGFGRNFARKRELLEQECYSEKESNELKTKGDNLSEVFSGSTNCLLTNDGKIHFSLSAFSQAVNDVDITLIRHCKRCHKIFWAGRKDQSCCSDGKCKNQFHSKNKMSEKSQEKKKERRTKAIENLRRKYKGKQLWTEEITINIFNSNHKSFRSKKLQKGNTLTVSDICIATDKEEMPIRFFLEVGEGVEGFVDVEYSNQFRTNLKRVFWLSDS